MNKTQNSTRDNFPGISYIWHTPRVKENHRVTFLDKSGYWNEEIMAWFTSIILRLSVYHARSYIRLSE